MRIKRALCIATLVVAFPVAAVSTAALGWAGVQAVTGTPYAATACWVEKWQSVDTAEGICGNPALRPAGSIDVGTEVAIDHHVWVATVTGLEPVSAN